MTSVDNFSRCNNNGCKKKYLENENNENACKYHPGLPIFHDLKKGWTCCQKIVYDWDEFQKIEGCKIGPHCPKVTTNKPTDQSEFYQSQTVANAKSGIDNNPEPVLNSKPEPLKIDDINKEQEKIASKTIKEKKIVITASGKMRCKHGGCNKEYTEEENSDNICSYHSGEAVFHDTKKYWSCCKKESWDWDGFMKLPTCCIGKHEPKYK